MHIVDRMTAVLMLLILSFLLLTISLWIWLDSPGPVLHHHPKLGRNGKPFSMYGFRTMRIDSDSAAPAHERLTRAGRIVRNLSLDHLPQWFNVLRGEMAIVGPRPTEPDRIDLNDPDWQRILSVRPGMISPAILALGRTFNSSPQHVKNRYELAYVDDNSVFRDLRLMISGVRAMIASRGNVKMRGEPQKHQDQDT